MEFTYNAYKNMLSELMYHGYKITNYEDCDRYIKCAILRHDIDTSIEKAVRLAVIEHDMDIKSTYFVLISSKLYNPFSRVERESLKYIKSLGHDIGLHFDELSYSDEFYDKNGGIENIIKKECGMLECALQSEIKSVSMHRPSAKTLKASYEFDGLINSYSDKFFKQYKYLSDSRRNWREDVLGIIRSETFDKLHILAHAFWYNEDDISIEKSIGDFIACADVERYEILEENIRDLNSIFNKEKLKK